MLITIQKAAQLTGRSEHTIRDWGYKFGLPIVKTTRPWQVDTDDLQVMARRLMHNYYTRPIRPGPGRGHVGEPAGPLTKRRSHQK